MPSPGANRAGRPPLIGAPQGDFASSGRTAGRNLRLNLLYLFSATATADEFYGLLQAVECADGDRGEAAGRAREADTERHARPAQRKREWAG